MATTINDSYVFSGSVSATGNIDITTAGSGLRVAQGANAKQGTIGLTAGAVGTVANTSVTNGVSIIVPGYTAPAGTPGAIFVKSVTTGTGFVLASTSAGDTSVVGYQIFEPG